MGDSCTPPSFQIYLPSFPLSVCQALKAWIMSFVLWNWAARLRLEELTLCAPYIYPREEIKVINVFLLLLFGWSKNCRVGGLKKMNENKDSDQTIVVNYQIFVNYEEVYKKNCNVTMIVRKIIPLCDSKGNSFIGSCWCELVNISFAKQGLLTIQHSLKSTELT